MSPSAPKYRLPDAWGAPESVEDVIVADNVPIHRAGLSTIAADGEEVCGSAADVGGPALSRAWFELLERVSALEALKSGRASYGAASEQGHTLGTWSRSEVFPESDAPQSWRYARSNGIALHVDWGTACRRALWELAERDRVIRSWHGEIAPRLLAIDHATSPLSLAASYEWRVYSFPEHDETSFSCGVQVAGVFGLPVCEDVPFVLGLAGRSDMGSAVDAATAEALQLLAFLWGEPPPEEPIPAAPGPTQHLDRYQVRGAHVVVQRWLEGQHLAYGLREKRTPCTGVGYVDLTPSWLPDGLRVAKAVCREAAPLVFGESPFAAHLPPELRIHPIP